MSLGDHVGAEAALTHALELAPNDPNGESLLGWAQMLQEKYDDALLNFQKVLMRQPQNSLARVNVGYICLKKEIFGEAIEHLSKAIRLDTARKADRLVVMADGQIVEVGTHDALLAEKGQYARMWAAGAQP